MWSNLLKAGENLRDWSILYPSPTTVADQLEEEIEVSSHYIITIQNIKTKQKSTTTLPTATNPTKMVSGR